MRSVLIKNAMIVPDVSCAYSWAYKFDLGYLLIVDTKIKQGGYGEYEGNLSPSQIIDAGGLYLAPALIDLQLNGLMGCDFPTATPEKIEEAILQAPKFGVGGLMPTITTNPIPTMINSLININDAAKNPNVNNLIIGPHLEGPFLEPKYCGSHAGDSCLSPDIDAFHQLMEPIPLTKKSL